MLKNQTKKGIPVVVVTLLVTEVVSLIAGLLMAVVATRPESGFSPAGRFMSDPSFLMEFAVSFGLTNVLLSGFALAFLATRGFGRVDRR